MIRKDVVKTSIALVVVACVTVAGVYLLNNTKAASGEPTTAAQGSLVERACTRTYGLTGMQIGTAGDPNANGNRMRAVLAAAQGGDCITVAAGHYRLAGNIEFTVANVTLKGLGANREAVWFEHTTETRAIFMVKAGGVHFYNFTHRVFGSARSSLGQSGEGNIWVQGGHSGFRMQDVLAWGSRDAAIFLYGVHNFELNRVESRDSKSDAYHISNGSSNGKWYDSVSRNSGDDGLGFVGYGGEGAGTPHHHTVVRHHVAGQTWGRGVGIIHVNNINFYGPTLIEDTAGAGIIMAREAQYGSGSVRAIRFYGEVRIRRANHHEGIPNHGAIMMHNDSTSAAIEDVLIEGPVRIVDTGKNMTGGVAQHVKAHGSGRIQAEIRNASFYGSGPATKLVLGLAGGSSVTTPGWSNSTGFSGAEPAFAFTSGGTVTPPPPPSTTTALAITTPANGQVVSGIVTLSGTHNGMQNIEVFNDGAKLATATITGGNWSANVNTTAIADGSETFTVTGWDAPAGQPFTLTDSKSVSLQVANTVQPPSPPVSGPLIITAPAASESVGANVTFSGTHDGLKNVEIFYSGTKLATATMAASTWTATVSTAAIAEGPQTFTATGWDSLAGQPFTRSESKTVTVAVTKSSAIGNGDTNNDGRVNAVDLSVVLSRDGQNYPSADFNKDGTVGAADMAILLSKWTW